MCLAVPGRIVTVEDREGARIGRVDFGGVVREAWLDFVPDATAGDYVIVHVGVAISRVDEDEALATYRLLSELAP
jgi:hydrogenase expression/formation protein HypC